MVKGFISGKYRVMKDVGEKRVGFVFREEEKEERGEVGEVRLVEEFVWVGLFDKEMKETFECLLP